MSFFAVAPALPLHAAGKYVAGAYIVFVLVILIYVTIMATRLSRTERTLVELNRDMTRREAAGDTLDATDSGRSAGDTKAPEIGREPARLSGAGRGPGDSPL
jgi:hypothetical protein